jgi:protease secretion system membrane fusion protein
MAKISFLNARRDAQDAQPLEPVAPASAAETALADDGRRASRIGLWALAVGFGGFLLWASFAPLDEGVAAPGLVSIDTKRKAVQHLTGGIVKEVHVREGQQVKEGQVLVKLDEATARANFEASRQRYLSLRAMEGRLQADQAGLTKVTFHPDLVANSSDPMIKAQMSTQEQLLSARRGSLNADLQSINEQVHGQEASIQAYTSMFESRKGQLALLNEELKNTRGLVAEGYAPRNRQLELERMVAEANTSMADLQGNILRGRRSIGDLKSRAISRQQDYRKEIETQLADVSREVLSEAEKFRALQNELGRIDIKAPVTGQVVGLAVQTPGAVISPGQKLMDIVPQGEPLLLEARVAPNFIDRVHAGLPVDIRFATFAHAPTLVVDGKVTSISGDLLTDQATNQSYFLARVEVTPEGLKQLGNRQLQPGMPTEVIFRTGERSMLTYLLGPLYKRMSASMKEA